jgi:chlorite dismutase
MTLKQTHASCGGSLEHFITDLSIKVEPGPVPVIGMYLVSNYSEAGDDVTRVHTPQPPHYRYLCIYFFIAFLLE